MGNKNLAIADAAGMRGLLDRFHRPFYLTVFHDNLDLHLGEEVDHVFRAAIQLGMAFLSAKTLGFGDSDSLNADFVKAFLDLIKLEGFDDRFDLLQELADFVVACPE